MGQQRPLALEAARIINQLSNKAIDCWYVSACVCEGVLQREVTSSLQGQALLKMQRNKLVAWPMRWLQHSCLSLYGQTLLKARGNMLASKVGRSEACIQMWTATNSWLVPLYWFIIHVLLGCVAMLDFNVCMYFDVINCGADCKWQGRIVKLVEKQEHCKEELIKWRRKKCCRRLQEKAPEATTAVCIIFQDQEQISCQQLAMRMSYFIIVLMAAQSCVSR